MSEGKTETYEPPEWLSWDKLKAYMVGTGLCGPIEHPTIVGAWAASGDLDTRAQHLIWNGQNRRNEIIPKDAWGLARKRQGSADLGKGRLVCDGFLSSVHDNVKLEAWGIEVRASQLMELAPLPENAAENFSQLRVMKNRTPPTEAAIPNLSKRTGGSSGKVARWHDFYLTVLQMLNEGELEAFESQRQLRAALLSRIGEDLSDESIKRPVSTIWHQVLGKD